MDTQQTNQPVNDVNQQSTDDDKELAKVLAGFSDDVAQPVVSDPVQATDMAVGDMPTPQPPVPNNNSLAEPQVVPPAPSPVSSVPQASSVDSDLDSIKEEALGELHPLVDKLNVAPKEKFDTYLLLLRSTDDKSLIAPAHEAAKAIPDESQRAEALLDIIKEIDFLKQA